MSRLRFPLTSEQLELLLAFETASGLNHLAEMMARDPSVVSRNLQRIAEQSPVLKKVKGRWELTPLGAQVNQRTRVFLEDQTKLFSSVESPQKSVVSDFLDNAILVIINAQKALAEASSEGRNNLEAEQNISRLLDFWRKKNRRLVHVKHISEKAESAFFRNSSGSHFQDWAQPKANEVIIEKTKSSAFTGTDLDAYLNKESASQIVLVGFTASECIDATAKDAAALGYQAVVVGDGTATFDLRDPSGKLIKADRIHRLTLIHINAFYGKVMNTREILNIEV